MSSQDMRWPGLGCFTISTAYNIAKIHLSPFSSVFFNDWSMVRLATSNSDSLVFFLSIPVLYLFCKLITVASAQKQKATVLIPRGNIKICLDGLHIFSIKRFKSASGMYMNKNHFAYKSCYFHMKYICFPIFLGCPSLVIEECCITLQNGFLGSNKMCKFLTLNCIPKTICPARDIFSRSVHFIVCKMFHFSYYLQYFNIKLLLKVTTLSIWVALMI